MRKIKRAVAKVRMKKAGYRQMESGAVGWMDWHSLQVQQMWEPGRYEK